MAYYSAVFLISATATPVHREHGAQQQHIRYKKLGYLISRRATLDRGYFKVTEVKVVGLCGDWRLTGERWILHSCYRTSNFIR